MKFRDLEAQYQALKRPINEAVEDVMRRGQYIGGEPVEILENRLAEYVGVKHCVTCANGTDALQLALMAWGVGPGDAVFVPDFTFFSSGEVVAAVGATPVFVDVLTSTFNISVDSLSNAVEYVKRSTELNPRVVVSVDLFGLPADYDSIIPYCKREGLLLLEDGAQGFGGAMRGRRACSFGDISTTSFFPAKPLGCYGDGGAIFTDSDEWAALLRSYAVHGKGTMKYDNIRVGMNSRLDTLQAAILGVKLDEFKNHEVSDVNKRAVWYNDLLNSSNVSAPLVPEGYVSSWAQYTIIVPSDCDRDKLQMVLRDAGIPTMVYYWRPMHQQPAFDNLSICPDGCPVTEMLCKSVLSLPMGPYLMREHVETVALEVMSAT